MYDGGVFFDNAGIHIAELATFPNIGLVKVDDSGPHIPTMSMDGDTPLAALIASLPKPNLYLDVIRSLGIHTDSYDPRSGIVTTGFETYQKIVIDHIASLRSTHTHDLSHYVIFDWDRTLTKFEGLFMEDEIFPRVGIVDESIKTQYREDMLRYLFGGYDRPPIMFGDTLIPGIFRLDAIRDFITWLLTPENRIAVFILTNNRSCGTGNFINTVRAFHPGIKPAHIICSYPLGGDKGLAAAASGFIKYHELPPEYLAGEPPPAGGAGASYGGRRSRKNKKCNRRTRNRKRNRH